MKQQTQLRRTTANNVRAEMARRGVTQSQVASVLGIGQSAVSGKLIGRSPFDIDEIALIAEWLNVPVFALIADEPVPFPRGMKGDVRTITREYADSRTCYARAA